MEHYLSSFLWEYNAYLWIIMPMFVNLDLRVDYAETSRLGKTESTQLITR